MIVFADAELIERVLQNLLGNAFEYSPRGRVVVSASDGPDSVACVVRDDGAGIPAQMLARVFDPRVTDPAKEGTGFGLAIVKRIIEAHGGTVEAKSIHGAGATFQFTLLKSRAS